LIIFKNNYMKRLSIFLSAIIFLIAGCSKKLDIQPTQSVDEQLVFSNDANIKAALTGAYDVISGGSLFGGDLQMYSELLGAGGEIRWVGTYQQPREIYNKAMLTNNSFIRNTYTEGYRAINICNNIIAAIEKVNEKDRDKVKGQALLIRGMMYFELVKLFAKPYSDGNATTNMGLQIVTTPTVAGQITEANKVPRSSVAATYDQIIADLLAAKTLLDGTYGVYVGKYTAAAVLSRVYLQTANYAGARDEANDVIKNSGASLESNYDKAFNNTAPSTEDIYVLPVTAQDGANDMQLYWSISDYGARDGDIEIRQAHINLYEANDTRRALFYQDESDIFRSGKWKFQYRYIPVIRLAEMYLTRAECNFRLATSVGSTPDEDLNNIIRKRAGLAPEAVSLANILMERRLELAHEGQRIHDIKRLKLSVDGFGYDDNKLVFPIPAREVNAGAGILVQNPGY
jgi:starch-binding outer membrane protein, SusD/RagB family